MFWRKLRKPKSHYYLLPGMSGRAIRRKRRWMLAWGISLGLIVSAIIGLGLYFLNRP
jgi:hypothetical protein